MVVYYENGYALLEKIDTKESFMDLIIPLEDMADFFVKHGHVNSVKDFVDNFVEKSKDAMRKVIFYSKDNFLKDGRVFQLKAFDFIIDKNMNIWLVDIKINPMYSLKNKDLVTSVLDRQFKILNYRNNMYYEHFHRLKKSIDKHIYN